MGFRIMALAVALSAAWLTATAQSVFDVDLWPEKARVRSSDKADTARVRVFLPAKKSATGRAVVICPGGAYEHLAIGHEGYDWAPFFNDMGIAAIVLKYRMPHGNPDVPVSDAEEALKLVRRNASKWNINPDDVGIMGFSAGGHLASTVATHSVGEALPNFQILFYPVITMMQGYAHQGSRDNLLGTDVKKKTERQYCSDMHVTRVTPRACIILCDDDDIVQPSNGVNYYTELFRYDVPAALYVYPLGGHGFGMNTNFRFHIEMLLDLKAWLRSF